MHLIRNSSMAALCARNMRQPAMLQMHSHAQIQAGLPQQGGWTAKGNQRHRRSSLHIRNALDSGTVLAVTQQCGSFIFTVMGETLWNRAQLPKGAPGRPSLPLAIVTSIGVAAAVASVQSSDTAEAGLALGTGVSAILLANYIKRFFDTEGDEAAWPGPKVWPATMSLIAFFATTIFFQSLQKALDPTVIGAPLN